MAHLIRIMQLIQSVSTENPEIDKTLKNIIRLLEENDALKKEKETVHNESKCLQKELERLQNIIIECPAPMKSSLYLAQSLKLKINKLDLNKTVLCDLIKLEGEYNGDCQLYENLTTEHLKQQSMLRQRSIVKDYHDNQRILNNTQRMFDEMKKEFTEQAEFLQMERRKREDHLNKLIIEVVKCVKVLEQQEEQIKLKKKQEEKLNEGTKVNQEKEPTKVDTENVTDAPRKEITKFSSLFDMIRDGTHSLTEVITYINSELESDTMKKSVQFKEPLATVKTFNVPNHNNDSDIISESSSDCPLSIHQTQKIESCVIIEETDEEQDCENKPPLLKQNHNSNNVNDNNENENTNSNGNDISNKKISNMQKSPIHIQECLVIKPLITDLINDNTKSSNNKNTGDANFNEVLQPNFVELQTTTAMESTNETQLFPNVSSKTLSQESLNDEFTRYLNKVGTFFENNDIMEPNDNNAHMPQESMLLATNEQEVANTDFITDNNFFDFGDDNNNTYKNYIL